MVTSYTRNQIQQAKRETNIENLPNPDCLLVKLRKEMFIVGCHIRFLVITFKQGELQKVVRWECFGFFFKIKNLISLQEISPIEVPTKYEYLFNDQFYTLPRIFQIKHLKSIIKNKTIFCLRDLNNFFVNYTFLVLNQNQKMTKKCYDQHFEKSWYFVYKLLISQKYKKSSFKNNWALTAVREGFYPQNYCSFTFNLIHRFLPWIHKQR